jgi:hypothetical protein
VVGESVEVSVLLFPKEPVKMFGIAVSGALGNAHAALEMGRNSLLRGY